MLLRMKRESSFAIRPSRENASGNNFFSKMNVLYWMGLFMVKKKRLAKRDLLLFGDSFAKTSSISKQKWRDSLPAELG